MRVVSRLYALEEDVLLASSRKHVKELLLQVYPKNRASDFVQGLMELGELVCIPKTPRCEDVLCKQTVRRWRAACKQSCRCAFPKPNSA